MALGWWRRLGALPAQWCLASGAPAHPLLDHKIGSLLSLFRALSASFPAGGSERWELEEHLAQLTR
jgi:hypothetical protein